ncbi:hypothetical protein [Pseudomonas bijieensis]|uniref:hypothetical protein n=1 Tax=Pseudomonas bijieensis TaxID=2681983 RepID=UPI001E3E61F0|nr:hypothetical protein [Pseudomonas bijieensis]MCD9117019.1 hypothetical protein [Pseudomonas bijieensis]
MHRTTKYPSAHSVKLAAQPQDHFKPFQAYGIGAQLYIPLAYALVGRLAERRLLAYRR